MWKPIVAMALVASLAASLAACAGLEPVGRNAGRSPAPTPAAQPSPPPQVAPPPPQRVEAPAVAPQVSPPPPQRVEAPIVAPQVSAPPPPVQTAAGDDDIVVPGQRDTQVPPPNGDPRSVSERVRDIRAWDQCVSAVQAVYEDDPMRPQLETPEDVCTRQLGMADRDAVPITRRQRR